MLWGNNLVVSRSEEMGRVRGGEALGFVMCNATIFSSLDSTPTQTQMS